MKLASATKKTDYWEYDWYSPSGIFITPKNIRIRGLGSYLSFVSSKGARMFAFEI